MCTKWILLDENMCKEYEVKCITCKNCGKYTSKPYFIHDIYGDWLCFKCNKEGSLIYFCLYCKHKNYKK